MTQYPFPSVGVNLTLMPEEEILAPWTEMHTLTLTPRPMRSLIYSPCRAFPSGPRWLGASPHELPSIWPTEVNCVRRVADTSHERRVCVCVCAGFQACVCLGLWLGTVGNWGQNYKNILTVINFLISSPTSLSTNKVMCSLRGLKFRLSSSRRVRLYLSSLP